MSRPYPEHWKRRQLFGRSFVKLLITSLSLAVTFLVVNRDNSPAEACPIHYCAPLHSLIQSFNYHQSHFSRHVVPSMQARSHQSCTAARFCNESADTSSTCSCHPHGVMEGGNTSFFNSETDRQRLVNKAILDLFFRNTSSSLDVVTECNKQRPRETRLPRCRRVRDMGQANGRVCAHGAHGARRVWRLRLHVRH